MLGQAIANEVKKNLQTYSSLQNESGRRLVVRKGSLPARNLVTGGGPVWTNQPRVQNSRMGEGRPEAATLPSRARIR